eukprot:augustus_masked-scaffold_68-processed-gene-0.5-mRNA-1 protein AED:1.00 eAED:1.00 QI:0/0/0/0/1/1/4/0/425
MQKIENLIEDVPTLENDPENSPERTELEVWEHFEAATGDEMFLHVSTVANVEALEKIKKFIQQLTAEELQFIKTLGSAETNISAALIALHRPFPGALFSKRLIRREMNKAKENNSNSEDTNLVKLMNCGNKCIRRGGSFNLHFNHGSILTGVTFREGLQLKLAELYGDSIQIDTPHGLTRYRLVAMFPNSNDVKRGLEELNLNKAEVMMSDGSPALAKVVKSCGAKHIRCLKHFAATFSEAAKGLKGSDLVEFRKELAEIITGSFPNLRVLDNSFKEMMEKFTEPAQREEFTHPDNLLPRWRYQDHPLYLVALKELRRVKTSETKGIEFKVKVTDLEMKAVPTSGEAKYSRLLAECKLLAEEAKHSDEGWRKVFATVRKMRRAVQNNPDGNFAQLQCVSDDTVATIEPPQEAPEENPHYPGCKPK